MITDEQVKQACAAYEKHRSLNVFSDNLHAMRKALEAYEQSKWVKFDKHNGDTYPEREKEVLLDTGYGYVSGWLCIEENPDSRNPDDHYNTCWVCLDGRYEIDEIGCVPRWQPLPEFKE